MVDGYLSKETCAELNQILRKNAVIMEPARHGKWVVKRTSFTQGHYECSECGYIDQRKPNYCGNCGARMDNND